MVTRILLGLLGMAGVVGTVSAAKVQTAFQRPDCSAFAGRPEAESSCFRKARRAVTDENYAALQKTGLEFVYLARPVDGKELEKGYPEAFKAARDKVEGEFLLTFSVNTNGDVFDVKVVATSSEPIGHLAKLWGDTIKQWKFVKTAKPVTDVPFRRIYLYSKEDEGKRGQKSGG